MVVGKHSKSIVKAKGSPELNDKLLTGDVQRIADAFGMPYYKLRGAIVGKHYGDIRVIRCAEALADFYDSVNLRDKVEQILHSHVD